MSRFLVSAVAVFLLSSLSCVGAYAAADSTRVSEEFRQALLRLAQSGDLAGARDPMLVERPAERVANLGLLLDRDHDDGLRVLGTLPGGSAERIGLRAGDRLVAVNGIDLKGGGGTERMRSLLDTLDSADALSMELVREGREQRLAGMVDTFELPAMRIELLPGDTLAAGSGSTGATGDAESTCGRISVFGNTPRSQNLFSAVLLQVDGKQPGPSSQDTFRVTPGRHTLTVAEAIDPTYFSDIENRQRGRGGDTHYKTLEVTIEPGVTYHLAARHHPEGRVADGSYWEPAIWKDVAVRCR